MGPRGGQGERQAFFVPATRNLFLVESPMRSKGPKVSKGRPESPLVASAEAKPSVMRGKQGRLFSCLPQGICFLWNPPMRSKGPKVSKGRPESPLVASAEAKAFVIRKRKVGPFPAFRKKAVSCGRFRPRIQGWAPKGSRGRSESPLVASAEAKSFVIREKKGRPFSCLPQAVCFLWEVSSACGRTRYFPSLESTQRVPGAAKGCMEHGRPRTPRC